MLEMRSLDREDPLEKEMATHSNILAWEIPWTEEPGRLQSMGSQRIGHMHTHTHNTQLKQNILRSHHNNQFYVRYIKYNVKSSGP